MNIEIHRPELERRVREGIQSGRFRDVDDLITKALDALSEKEESAAVTGQAEEHRRESRPIWEVILDNMKDTPPAEFEKLPKDGAAEVDHYLYGHPKRNQ